jgi:hypothetical protein
MPAVVRFCFAVAPADPLLYPALCLCSFSFCYYLASGFVERGGSLTPVPGHFRLSVCTVADPAASPAHTYLRLTMIPYLLAIPLPPLPLNSFHLRGMDVPTVATRLIRLTRCACTQSVAAPTASTLSLTARAAAICCYPKLDTLYCRCYSIVTRCH